MPFQRGDPVGRFRVSFQFVHRPFGKPAEDVWTTPIGLIGPVYEPRDGGVVVLVEDQPKVASDVPYEGALNQHELEWLMTIPGLTYNVSYRFSVEPLDDQGKESIAALLV